MTICVICKKPEEGFLGGDGLCKEHGNVSSCPTCHFVLQLHNNALVCRKCGWKKQVWRTGYLDGEEITFRRQEGKIRIQKKLKGD